jgi:hypothetical protein
MLKFFDVLDGSGEIIVAEWNPELREPRREPSEWMWLFPWRGN